MRNHRFERAVLVIALALASVATPAKTGAVCDGPMPSFREAVATAQRIVIGDVVKAVPTDEYNGFALAFDLKVSYVLRGDAPALISFDELPSQPCAPPIVVHEGDRLAIAFEARVFAAAPPVNAAAFLRGTPAHAGVEQLSEVEVFSLVGEAVPPGVARDGPAAWTGLLLFLGLAIVSVVLFRASRRIRADTNG